MSIGIAWQDVWNDASWADAWNSSVESGDTSGSGDLPKTVATFTVATIGLQIGAGPEVAPPSTDGTAGGRSGRILSLRKDPLVFTDRPSKIHIDQITPSIDEIKADIEGLEIRESRMQHMLMAARGLEKAATQLKRLERLQAQLRLKRAILDDEEAFILVLTLL